MKKIKTIEAVTAYRTLKALKTSSMPSMFRSVCTYGNNKTTYGRGYVSNSSGQGISSITVPNGNRTDYIEVYIRFDNIYDGGYYGQMCQLSFEVNIS